MLKCVPCFNRMSKLNNGSTPFLNCDKKVKNSDGIYPWVINLLLEQIFGTYKFLYINDQSINRKLYAML